MYLTSEALKAPATDACAIIRPSMARLLRNPRFTDMRQLEALRRERLASKPDRWAIGLIQKSLAQCQAIIRDHA